MAHTEQQWDIHEASQEWRLEAYDKSSFLLN